MVKTVVVKVASLLAAGACAAGMAGTAAAQDTKIALGMSGWTGFAPLSLADKAGIFKKNGLDVELKMIPQKDRHLALASGAIQCAATTVETHVAWNANGVPIVQIFQMDKSYGADGLAVRNDVKSFADLKGKSIGVSAPGTAPYFGLAWMLSKNGMSLKDVKVVSLEPQPAAQAFVAGQNDAAMTYEPYLSTVRANPAAGKILATTLDYPMVMDTVGCAPTWLKANAKAAAGAHQVVLRCARDDQGRPGQGQRAHGLGRQAERRAVRQVVGLPALAGQGRQPEVLRGRTHQLHEGSRGDPAGSRRDPQGA
jgi:NitT/TauT family transport system substrate-binding protein